MHKKIIFIIILIVVLVVGYQLLKPSQPSSGPEDEEKTQGGVMNLLKNIKQETGIDFSKIKEAEFNWITGVDPKVEEVNIQGKGFEVKEISDEEYNKVEMFLQDKDFEIDNYNIFAGTIAGAVGYKKDKVVCLIIAGVAGYKEATDQWIPEEWSKNDVEVKCGELEDVSVDEEQACVDSGGTVRTSMCCESTDDFPNLCLVGPCGCAPDYSHEVEICDCGEGCWDGEKCVNKDI